MYINPKVAELEALEEVHEQLVESNHDLEMDLREEVDMAMAAKREVRPINLYSLEPHRDNSYPSQFHTGITRKRRRPRNDHRSRSNRSEIP